MYGAEMPSDKVVAFKWIELKKVFSLCSANPAWHSGCKPFIKHSIFLWYYDTVSLDCHKTEKICWHIPKKCPTELSYLTLKTVKPVLYHRYKLIPFCVCIYICNSMTHVIFPCLYAIRLSCFLPPRLLTHLDAPEMQSRTEVNFKFILNCAFGLLLFNVISGLEGKVNS